MSATPGLLREGDVVRLHEATIKSIGPDSIEVLLPTSTTPLQISMKDIKFQSFPNLRPGDFVTVNYGEDIFEFISRKGDRAVLWSEEDDSVYTEYICELRRCDPPT